MTEIDDLGQLFGQPQRLTRAQREHMERVQEYERSEMLKRIELVQFFAPILCNCAMAYDREDPYPPQIHCPIHGMMMSHPYTGQPVLPGMPVQPAMFTPEAGETHPHDDEDKR
jgi:hypothetical protein